MYAPSGPEARAELRERARRLRWWLVAAAGAAFAAAAGLVISDPIGTQAQAASPPAAQPGSQDGTQAQAPRSQYQQPRSAFPPVADAPQPQPILRTRRS